MNENEKHNIPKLMGHNKTDTKGNLQAHIKKQKRPQIINLNLQLKELEKEKKKRNLRLAKERQ